MNRPLEQMYKSLLDMRFNHRRVPDGTIKGDYALATQNLMNATYAFAVGLAHPDSISVAQRRMTKAVRTDFVRFVNAKAAANPKAFWHMYRGQNHVGVGAYRLFNIAAPNGQLKSEVQMALVYLPDNSLASVDQRLARGGQFAKSGGRYVKKRHKWPTKAFDVESGAEIIIKPKKSKVLVFVGREKNGKPKAVFVRTPIHINLAMGKSGKRATMGALTQAAAEFSETMAADSAMRSYKRQTKAVREAVEKSAVRNVKIAVPSRAVAMATARRVSVAARTEGIV